MNELTSGLMSLLVAALAGGLIGVERERSQGKEQQAAFAGVRTFPLISILGACLTLVSGGVGAAVISGFVGIAALVVASYYRTATPAHPGTTTEVAAFATYWIGVMAGAGALVLAGALGVGVAVLLASKERVEKLSRAMSQAELSATLTLAVLAAVILPVLPDTPIGPWGVWNPRKLWLVVVLVCGLSFAAFMAMRILGASAGLYLSGILGGLVSSTAAAISFATRSRENPGQGLTLSIAAGLASLVMIIRVGVLVAVTQRNVLPPLAPFLVTIALAGLVPMIVFARRKQPSSDGLEIRNPFQLKSALKFAGVYALVLLMVGAAERQAGSWGLVAAAGLAGLVDVDAITIALASSSLPAGEAAGGIAVATLSNTFAKAGYAVWFGRGGYRTGMLIILGSALVSGVIVMLVLGPRITSG